MVAQDVADRIIGWWVDLEHVDWDRDGAVVRIPVEKADVKVKFGVSRAKGPGVYRHQLTLREVTDLAVEHDGGYPFAQPIEGVVLDVAKGDIHMSLGFGSTLLVRTRSLDAGVVILEMRSV
ncbi:MAG: hypothetical protein Q8O56_06360 [Solirubrobacteraceae bacterium]|nr:hypothetical protein [Solirubrobacteraceae bacterium]